MENLICTFDDIIEEIEDVLLDVKNIIFEYDLSNFIIIEVKV